MIGFDLLLQVFARMIVLGSYGFINIVPVNDVMFLNNIHSSDLLDKFKSFFFNKISFVSPEESRMFFSYFLAEFYLKGLLPRPMTKFFKENNIPMSSVQVVSNAYYKSVLYKITIDGTIDEKAPGIYSYYRIGKYNFFGNSNFLSRVVLTPVTNLIFGQGNFARVMNTMIASQNMAIIFNTIGGAFTSDKEISDHLFRNQTIIKSMGFSPAINLLIQTFIQEQSSMSASAAIAGFGKMRQVAEEHILERAKELAAELVTNLLRYATYEKHFKNAPEIRTEGLRSLPLSKSTQKDIILYIRGMVYRHKEVQKYENLIKKTDDDDLKNFYRNRLKQVKFPSILVAGAKRKEVLKTVIYYIHSSVLPVNYVSLSTRRVKETLSSAAISPDGQIGNWLIMILKIVQQDKRINKLLWFSTDTSKIDLFILYDAEDLLKTRFDSRNSDIKQLVALNLFLDKLHRGPFTSYGFTIHHKEMFFDIDPAIKRRISNTIDSQKIKMSLYYDVLKKIFELNYRYDLFTGYTISEVEFAIWFCHRIRNNHRLVHLLTNLVISIYRQQMYEIKTNKRIVPIGIEVLNRFTEGWNLSH